MTLATELQAILDNDPDDILHAEVAHDWARDHPESFLHRALEWDDQKAGYEYRLGQIRHLIKIHIRDERGEPAVISLRQDRVAGGGYRRMADVVETPNLRQMALQEAIADLRRVQRRYEHLQELSAVWTAVDTAERRVQQPPARRDRRRRREENNDSP
jgi:hypothetical protein